ncbi:hypothetical protein BDQ17DRAFT_750470 [Cyathus striatus]|nr:hypothetical protein BDQ17DRAFT_750470 [Cyathus striatus]
MLKFTLPIIVIIAFAAMILSIWLWTNEASGSTFRAAIGHAMREYQEFAAARIPAFVSYLPSFSYGADPRAPNYPRLSKQGLRL